MDPVPLAIACGPLAAYLLWLGLVNLRRRPVMMTGGRDAALLAVAVAGLAIVGPMNLFLPEAAGRRFGPYAWPLLAALYVLCVVLYTQMARPRLVIFNFNVVQLRTLIAEIVQRLDHDSRLAGDAVQMPSLAVQFHLESSATMRNVTLISTGDQQSQTGWKRLAEELRNARGERERGPKPARVYALSGGISATWVAGGAIDADATADGGAAATRHAADLKSGKATAAIQNRMIALGSGTVVIEPAPEFIAWVATRPISACTSALLIWPSWLTSAIVERSAADRSFVAWNKFKFDSACIIVAMSAVVTWASRFKSPGIGDGAAAGTISPSDRIDAPSG